MESGHSRSAGVAGLLSAVLPGLGQFYNRQWGKGLGFLLGVFLLVVALLGMADLEQLQRSAATGAPPVNIGQLFLLSLLILVLAVWSIVDAARSAKRSNR